ncbi:hypothetical protein Ciccas_004572 [Cichlidogyrus casuarinus]|uniref:Uncharacterized protein n=1 Tax=Cichlidogyrus casuarinus TaxID=1844966 RepID=A0ABD2QB47_9PLAT
MTRRSSTEEQIAGAKQLDLSLARRPLPRLETNSQRSSLRSLMAKTEDPIICTVDVNANKVPPHLDCDYKVKTDCNLVKMTDADTDCLLLNGRAVVFLEYGEL